MYRIILRPSAARQARRLPRRDYERIAKAIDTLAEDPRPHGIEKLQGASLWRLRIGDYRVIYAIDDEQMLITVVRIGHRREIYRRL